MKQLLADIRAHPRTTLGFVAYWLAVHAFAFLTGSGGMSCPAVILHLSTPVVAGAIVGLWRLPAREGLFVDRKRLAGAPLAAALVAIATVTVVFVADAIRAVAGGVAPNFNIVDFVLSWAAASLIMAILSLVFGLFGALVSTSIANAVR